MNQTALFTPLIVGFAFQLGLLKAILNGTFIGAAINFLLSGFIYNPYKSCGCTSNIY